MIIMLESHQPLIIMLKVWMHLFSAHVNLSSLVYFARVITFSRTVPVFPLCHNCGLNILCHQYLIIMLMMPHQPVNLWLRVEKERLDILSCYVRICIELTFVLAWMKLQSCCKILLFLNNGFQEVIISCILTSH